MRPCCFKHRKPGLSNGLADGRVVIDEHRDLSLSSESAQDAKLDEFCGAPVMVLPKQQTAWWHVVPEKPVKRYLAQPLRAPAEVDQLMVLGKASRDGQPFLQRWVVGRGSEEAAPVLWTLRDVVEAVFHVGKYAIHVNDGVRPIR